MTYAINRFARRNLFRREDGECREFLSYKTPSYFYTFYKYFHVNLLATSNLIGVISLIISQDPFPILFPGNNKALPNHTRDCRFAHHMLVSPDDASRFSIGDTSVLAFPRRRGILMFREIHGISRAVPFVFASVYCSRLYGNADDILVSQTILDGAS